MYAVFFDYGNSTYRLPTNPEEIEVSSTQAIDKYEVLKLGQIAVPTHMELMQYSFECEFPLKWHSYVEAIDTNEDTLNTLAKNQSAFQPAGFYISLFSEWRNKFVPVRFLAGRVLEDEKLYDDSINTMVLIEELTIKEKAGEEGDKYISFKLLEYRDFNKIKTTTEIKSGSKLPGKTSNKTETNPKNKGFYVVQSGDCLWAIAKKYYGDGTKYTKIYNANKDKIKNPSLIYPGQKLVIP
jgi:LysM repeat protein